MDTENLRQLVNIILKNASHDHKEKTLQYASRILDSNLSPSVVNDPLHVADLIKKKLMRSHGSTAALRFSNLFSRLSNQPILTNLWSTLYLLLQLSDNEKSIASGFGITPQMGLLNIQSRTVPQQAYPEPMSPPPSSPIKNSAMTKAQIAEDTYERNGHSKVDEKGLLRDMIFIFQGVDGKYIHFEPKKDAIRIDATISKPIRDTLNRLAELGWLYKRISRFTERNVRQMGLVEQSFASVLKEHLSEYYQLVAELETHLESLTLKRLLIWTEDARHKLRLMSVLVDSSHVGGGALVSVIHAYANHGDPFIQKFTDGLLEQVSKPFFYMLQQWVYDGELQDPHDEFFVQNNVSVDDEKAWNQKHSLRNDMKPGFISDELAYKIFSIGKSLNFLRYSCKDPEWVDEQSHNQPTLTYGDLATLANSIDSAYWQTSKRLIDTLITRYRLIDHLNAAKRYMMLGQGDFAEALMDYLHDTLNQPANTLFRHNLTAALESAIRSSNAQYDDPLILQNLDARMLQISQGEIGWDIFTLEYKFEAPLSTIVSPSMLTRYLQMFHFLWRLKRVEYSLKQGWRNSMTGARRMLKIPDLEVDWHQCRIISAEMIHFVYQLQYYLLFEVIESAWADLVQEFEQNRLDLDNMIKAHEKYMERILSKSFLDFGHNNTLGHGREGQLLAHIKDIFKVILQYKDAMDSLYQFSLTEEARRAELRLLSRQRIDKKGIGIEEDEDEQMNRIPRKQMEQVLPRIKSRLQESAGIFQERLITLLSFLTTHRDQDVKFLAVRLNYSEHYRLRKGA